AGEDRLARILSVIIAPGARSGGRFSLPDARDLCARTQSFAEIGIYHWQTSSLTFPGPRPERVATAAVSANLFPVLGVQPSLGHPFSAGDDRPDAPPAVLLGYELWQRIFGADPTVVGRTVLVNGSGHRVVGVMPPGFHFPDWEEAWVPLASRLAPNEPRSEPRFYLMGRLRPGVSLPGEPGDPDTLGTACAGLPGDQRHPPRSGGACQLDRRRRPRAARSQTGDRSGGFHPPALLCEPRPPLPDPCRQPRAGDGRPFRLWRPAGRHLPHPSPGERRALPGRRAARHRARRRRPRPGRGARSARTA